ncbi:hypothetical protein [Streptomyces sp. NPDC060194]|uniref:hypothetical protein n=1 Tax=Streptomyces sp. NPDC060194 TaxID=3347069 RepID=UPI0036506151
MAKSLGVLAFVVPGLLLVATGFRWRGRAIGPWSAERAARAERRSRARQLLRSADMAIAAARREAGRGEPVIVTVDDVLDVALRHYGRAHLTRDEAAEALRRRYEAAGCRADCVTDAFGQGATRP